MKKIFVFLMLIFMTCLTAETGKLEEFEDELKKPVQHENNEDEDDNNNNDEDLFSNLDEDDDDNVFIQIFLYLTYELLIGSEPPLNYYKLPSRIYQDDFTGRYSLNGNSFDADLEIKYLYHSRKLDGISVNSNLFFFNAFNMKLLYQNLKEQYGNYLDKMDYYEIFVDYYRLRMPGVNWYWGVGAKGLRRDNYYLGFAMNTGLEIYPFRPVSLELSVNIGWLNAHPVSKLNAGMKIHYWKIMLSSEFQRLQTGDATINSINFGLGFNF